MSDRLQRRLRQKGGICRGSASQRLLPRVSGLAQPQLPRRLSLQCSTWSGDSSFCTSLRGADIGLVCTTSAHLNTETFVSLFVIS
jgi:hypothetical protein